MESNSFLTFVGIEIYVLIEKKMLQKGKQKKLSRQSICNIFSVL